MDLGLVITLQILAAFLLISLLSIAYFVLYKKYAHSSDPELGHTDIADTDLSTAKHSVRKFKPAEIDALVSTFTTSSVIDQGGFSTVYLASLQDSNNSDTALVAVKIHNSSQRLHRAFRQELDVLVSVNHPNIVRLIGHCDKRDEGILVFEYVPNGTLHDALHGNSVLPWSHRMSILFRIATAVDYLHEGCKLQIIHGDIKPSNVLLSADLEPKICDFGFARMGFSATVTRSANQMIGSLGYVDPHHLTTGMVSKKSDVYSFGVLILELVTGMEAFDPEKEQLLTAVMRPVLQAVAEVGMNVELVDPKLGDEYDADEVLVMTAIAARCVAEQPVFRPSMGEIVRLMRENVCIIGPKVKIET